MGDDCRWYDDVELCSWSERGSWWDAMQYTGRVAFVNCQLIVFLYSFSPCRQTSWKVLCKQPRRNFSSKVVAGWPTIRNHHWWVWWGTKNAHEYDKFEVSRIITNDTPCWRRVSAQTPIFNLIGYIVTRYTWTLESFRLWMGHAGECFRIVRPLEMNIHITSRGLVQSWTSSTPVHVRGMETLCCVMWCGGL